MTGNIEALAPIVIPAKAGIQVRWFGISQPILARRALSAPQDEAALGANSQPHPEGSEGSSRRMGGRTKANSEPFLPSGGRFRIRARQAAERHDRRLSFALYAAPLCRESDSEAWAEIDSRLARVDPGLVARRKERVSGAEGMWAEDGDPLSVLDTNEGFASRLIGAPDTILARIREFQAIGVDMLHLDLSDELFNRAVLPSLQAL